MAKKNNNLPTPKAPELEPKKEDQASKENDGTGLEKQETNGGADQTPDLKPETNDQASKENDGTGIESKETSEAKRVTAKRPLLHNGKAYTLEDDVTGVFEDEELERLLKIGAIVEA